MHLEAKRGSGHLVNQGRTLKLTLVLDVNKDFDEGGL